MQRFLIRFVLFAVITLSVAGTGISGQQASALEADAGQTQMTLSPTKQRVDIAPGKQYDGSFTIYNTGSAPLSFKVYATPYSVKSDLDYTPVFTQDITRTQLSRWVQLPQTTFSVAAGKSAEVPYHIVTPASIPAGGQYAAIFAETTEQKIGSVVTKKRVGMLIYARPNGQTIDKGSAEIVRLGSISLSGTLSSTTKLHNQGNTDFDSEVILTRKSVLGGQDTTTSETRTVLPESTRTVSLELQDTSFFAVYDVTQSARILGKITSQTTRVYVISPLILIGGSVLLVLILGGTIWRVVRKHKKPHSTTSR